MSTQSFVRTENHGGNLFWGKKFDSCPTGLERAAFRSLAYDYPITPLPQLVISVSENPRFVRCRFCNAIWRKKVAFENFPLFIWIKEPCVRKFEELERSKLLGISQTNLMMRQWYLSQTDVPFIIIIIYRPKLPLPRWADGAVAGKCSFITFWAHELFPILGISIKFWLSESILQY